MSPNKVSTIAGEMPTCEPSGRLDAIDDPTMSAFLELGLSLVGVGPA